MLILVYRRFTMRKDISYITSTSGKTDFFISISEDIGWIEPVFLLISPHLAELLRIDQEPSPFIRLSHFEVVSLADNCYALHFFDSDTMIRGDSKELKIVKLQHTSREQMLGKTYSFFCTSYQLPETSDYEEYGFFYTANNISYLTSFSAFAGENYR